MPVGANRPGKHWGLGGTKPSKEKVDDKSADSKDPEVPAKPAAKPIATDASQKSQAGLTAEEHFHELRIKVRQAGGPDLKTAGWTCTLVVSPKLEGAAADSATALDPCWTEPDGKQFFKRKSVLKFLNLSEPKKVTREEAALESREKFKELNTAEPLPRKIGEVTVLQWGKVVPERENFHSAHHIWPIGFKSRWIDEKEKEVTYESEIRDGKAEGSGVPEGLKDCDRPIFVVTVTRDGQDKQEFFGKNGKQVWRMATKDDKAKDHTGLKDEEVCKHLEGLKHAVSCKNYEFITTRPPRLDLDEEPKSPDKKKKKKKKKKGKGKDGEGASKEKESKAKVAGKKRKADGEPKKESQKAKRAREREEKLQEKAKEKEEKEKKAAALAEEKRLAREEEVRKRKEAKELQDIEHKWNSRYPIEDLALELEAVAMEEAKAAGLAVAAQRAAARAVVDAVERGWGKDAALAAGKEAAECRAGGDTDEEAHEKGMLKGEEVHEENPSKSDLPMDVDDQCYIDGKLVCRVGTRIKMLFKVEDENRKFVGFVSKCSDDSDNVSIHFYDENDEIEVPKGDQDVEMLAQGLLRLPSSVPVPQRAPVHSEDVLSVIRFIDAFKAELKLPKCTLNELQDAVESPANSELLAKLYQALLIGAMEATKDANHNAIVPSVWQGDDTLTNHTWPEVLRRWITCGPHAELNKKRFPEAVAAATCLTTAPAGAKSRPEGHLRLLQCLIEDCFDHADIHSAVDKRVDVADEAIKVRDEKVKDSLKEERVVQERIRVARETVARVDVGDEGTDAEPVPDEQTKHAIEMAKADATRDAGDEAGSTESEEAKALRLAFEEKHAEWKKRREERGGKAADKELNDALRQEKRLLDQRAKTETDCATKLEKFTLRQTPLGMDRYRNKYWWFPANSATLYVEPAMPPTGQLPPDPAEYAFEWRMWCGAEAMMKLSDCFCDQGVRESELKAGILKIVEKLGPDQVQSLVRSELKMHGPDDLKFYESFQVAQQEARNIHEVLIPEQQKTLAKELSDWEKILENPMDCEQMGKLLQALEHAVHESLAHTKRTKRESAAGRERANEGTAQNSSSVLNGPNVNDLAHQLPEEWQNDHEFVGKRVRRNVLADDGTHAGKANGTIVGYLPKEKSEFKSRQTNQDAALWRLKFDDPELGEGFEDLEEYEVNQAIQDYEKMQASLKSAASLRGVVVPTRGDVSEGGAADPPVKEADIEYDEGAIDMAEASNKVTGALWTSAMQREAWRREVESSATANSVVRICYSASVLCENVLRVSGKTRNDLSSAPRRTRTERGKRPREINDLAVFTGYTESGRRVKRVNYAENNDSDSD